MLTQTYPYLDAIATRNPNEFRIRLNGGFRPVFIGKLNTAGEGWFHTRKDEEKHLHRKSNSLALNAALLLDLEYQFRWVYVDLVHQDGRIERLVTSRRYFIDHGKSFRFQGWEPQIALGLSLWGMEKAEKYEAELNAQVELFDEVAA